MAIRRLSSAQVVRLVEGAEAISSVTGIPASAIVASILEVEPEGGEDVNDSESPAARARESARTNAQPAGG